MKRKLSLIVGILISLGTVSAQVVFKPGYVVDNQGVRTECLIKDYGWLYSPEKVVYKLSEDSAEITATVPEISAFGVQGADFIRREVNVDTSPLSVDNLSVNRMPEYEKRTVFLKVLHNGDISLYEYYNERPLYFYEMGGVTVPLVYKKYRDLESGSIRINSGYREQVKQFPGAADLSRSKMESMDYTASDLLRLFEDSPKPADKKGDTGYAVVVGGGISSFDYKVVKSGTAAFKSGNASFTSCRIDFITGVIIRGYGTVSAKSCKIKFRIRLITLSSGTVTACSGAVTA